MPISDIDLVHLICALRIALPDVDLILSTREPADFRDRMMGIGISKMSAGSRTEPGGYTQPDDAQKQFDIHDAREPNKVASAIEAHGFSPVWKDWDALMC